MLQGMVTSRILLYTLAAIELKVIDCSMIVLVTAISLLTYEELATQCYLLQAVLYRHIVLHDIHTSCKMTPNVGIT